MRLTTVIIIATIMQVSASSYAQKFTMRQKQVSINQVFKELKKQTGYDVFFLPEQLKTKHKIDVNFSAAPLNEVMEKCLEGQPLDFKIEDKTIVIKEKEVSFLDKLSSVISNMVRDLTIKGRVTDETGKPLPNASIQVKGKPAVFTSNKDGEFSIPDVPEDAILIIRYVGYKPLEIPVKGAVMPLEIKLNLATGELEEVKVVYNTGYQNIDKTRATGSFEYIDKELINRKISTDILSRIDGVSGVLFDKRNASSPKLQIRGLYTLTNAITQPLIVLDNFPYAGDIKQINPNDVESITILKDAAAASIWGAKAGNGVIVITTKKGKENQRVNVSFNASTSIVAKPDLFNMKIMATSDQINVEQFLFEKGYFDPYINYFLSPVTPVVDILNKQRAGLITQEQANLQIDVLRNKDVRNDFEKYIYRNELRQQYAADISGGGKGISYIFSAGYDKNLTNLIGNEYKRYTFRNSTTIKPVKNFDIQIGVSYAQGNTKTNSPGGYGDGRYNSGLRVLYPYAQLADENGNALPLDLNYKKEYTDSAGRGRLLDWKYRPLQDLASGNNNDQNRNIIADIMLRYSLTPGFKAEISYQYQRTDIEMRNVFSRDLFFTRNLINTYTQISGANIKYVVPNAGIIDVTNGKSETNNLRANLNLDKSWGTGNQIYAIAGAEIREANGRGNRYRSYGYTDQLGISNVDFLNEYPLFYGDFGTIPNNQGFSETLDRFVAVFGNAAYTYKNKYTLSGSARKDASNLFGVNSNQKGRPFWSAGASWNISDEQFYKINFLPELKFRVTYGYSGNVNQSARALTSIGYIPAIAQTITNIPAASIRTPGNPNLRWEKVRTINAAVDFALLNKRLAGSLEFYSKKSSDVLGLELKDITTGIASLSTNSANLAGNGVDLMLNASLISKSKIRLSTKFTFTYATYKVTKFLGNKASLGNVNDGSFIVPFEGYNPYSIISHRFAGLDPLNGDPQGYLNGKISKNYDSIGLYSPLVDQIVHGSALPPYFGNIINSLSLGNLALSFNITYRLGHYFRRPSIAYSGLFSSGNGNIDFANRWQKPGDEQNTNIPSMVYPSNSSRDYFFAGSEATVEKAGHIRLDDINLSYSITSERLKRSKIPAIDLTFYLTNINLLLYNANKNGYDPEFISGLKPGLSASFGARINLR